ncbi:MAG TPA: HAMP domain-containing sensor histidine kinase [Candidatus Saccharimonadales bacterium]|nr:HAMP domain-containing sensor histidine kinase [Candidatus Saccharimonadales bacterium]
MSHPEDRAVLDPAPDVDPVMDDENRRTLETEVRLATHLRGLSLVSFATAHDIRTPLHTIILYLELLRNTLAEAPEGERVTRQSRYVEVLASELQRLEVMLEQLILQTRLGPDKPERVDLVETVGELLEFLQPQGRKSHIEIAWEPAENPVFVQAGRESIRHALFHLLVTALEAGSEGEELRVGVVAREGSAVVTLAGPASLESYFRDGLGKEDAASKLLGSERGLHVARLVVERHRGTIEVRSGASRPTILEIQLPLAAAEV